MPPRLLRNERQERRVSELVKNLVKPGFTVDKSKYTKYGFFMRQDKEELESNLIQIVVPWNLETHKFQLSNFLFSLLPLDSALVQSSYLT